MAAPLVEDQSSVLSAIRGYDSVAWLETIVNKSLGPKNSEGCSAYLIISFSVVCMCVLMVFLLIRL